MSRPLLRDATVADMPAIQAIYAPHVLTGLASFEEAPPDIAEMTKRFHAIRELDLPYLVIEEAGVILGYAYASLYRTRPGYRWTVEDSVYVREGGEGKGVGRRLLEELIVRCEAKGRRLMIAVIGDSQNVPSIALHARCGFRVSGVLRSVGFKLGRWVDTVLMERVLGEGDRTPPKD